MKHPLRVVLCVLVVLYGLSLDHGLPHRYIPDDTVVTCALHMAQGLADGEGLLALVPAPGASTTTYPYALPYLDLGALSLRYVLGRVAGEWGGAGAFAEAVFEDARLAWLPARIVSALLGLGLAYGVYRAARELGRTRGAAALAALLAGSSLLMVQLAHTTRPWAATLGFAGLALGACLRLQRRHRRRDVVGAFLLAAAAGACFQVGLVYLGLPVAACLLLPGPRAPGRRVADLLLGLCAAGVLLLLVGYPYVLVHGLGSGAGHQTGESALLGPGEEPTLDLGGQAFSAGKLHGARWREVLSAWFGYDPLLVVLGLAGSLGLLLARGARAWSARLLVALPGLLLVALFLLYDGSHVRYLMSATPFLALAAAPLLVRLAGLGGLGRTLAVLGLALPLVQACRLDLLLGRTDTRTLAAQALLDVIGPDELAAVDGLGSLYGPPLLPRAETLQALVEDQRRRATDDAQRGQIWLGRREQRIVEAAAAGLAPTREARHLLPVQRYWRYVSYYPTDFLYGALPVPLAQWMSEWGVDVYVRVDRAPNAEPRAPVDEFTAAHGRLVWEISPTGTSPPDEASLPTDMSFALTQLWGYERPGPWIRVYRVQAPR